VDVGVHQDGLVHVSQLADNFVKDPSEVVKPGQKVSVTVTEIDLTRNRIALSMRSKPEVGSRSSGGPNNRLQAPSQRGDSHRNRSHSGGAAQAPKPNESVNDDWFSAALNKKP